MTHDSFTQSNKWAVAFPNEIYISLCQSQEAQIAHAEIKWLYLSWSSSIHSELHCIKTFNSVGARIW
jgi:hypothetical protein